MLPAVVNIALISSFKGGRQMTTIKNLRFSIDGEWKATNHKISYGSELSTTYEREIKFYNLLSVDGEKKIICSGAKLERTPPIGNWGTDPAGDFREDITLEEAWEIATPLVEWQEENPEIDCSVL